MRGYRFPDVEAAPLRDDKLLLRAFKIVRRISGEQQAEFLSMFLDKQGVSVVREQIDKESRRGEWLLKTLEGFEFPAIENPRSGVTAELNSKLVELGKLLLNPADHCRRRAHQLMLRWLTPLVAEYVNDGDTSRAEAATDTLEQVVTNYNPYKLFERDGASQWYSAADYVLSTFRRFEISYQKKSLPAPTRQAIRRYYDIRRHERQAGHEPTAELLLAMLKEEGVQDADLLGVRGFLESVSNHTVDAPAR